MKAELYNNMAQSLYKSGHRKTALAYVRRAVELEPHNPVFQCNLGSLLTGLGEYNEASQIFLKLVSASSNNALAWHGYGVLGLVAGHPEDAVRCFRQCLRIEPENAMHTFDLACALIQADKWEEGLALYENRRSHRPERSFKGVPSWNGERGRKVYVWAEQGIGDTIQFARFIPWLAERSEYVTFALPAPLCSLFKNYTKIPNVEIVSFNNADVDADCEIPLMSLMFMSGCEILPDPGYLKLDGYKNHITRIGVCWGCNSTSPHHQERSVLLEDLLALAEIPNTELYSLQVGERAGDIAKHQAQGIIQDLSHDILENWELTQKHIAGMDIVVSTDTSVAHLAGAMGKPTYMFLARRDWWRWGNEGIQTPWYPTMKIIRAAKPFEWKNEIRQVVDLLKAQTAEHKRAA